MRSINRVVLVCGLTRDPKLSYTPSGTPVVTLRVVFTTGRSTEGEWHEKPNYIDVEVWGAQAENAAKYLAKGRRIGVDGRLDWSEYEGNDGHKRQAHKVVAENVQYLPARAPAGTDAVADDALGAAGAQSCSSDGDNGKPARPGSE